PPQSLAHAEWVPRYRHPRAAAAAPWPGRQPQNARGPAGNWPRSAPGASIRITAAGRPQKLRAAAMTARIAPGETADPAPGRPGGPARAPAHHRAWRTLGPRSSLPGNAPVAAPISKIGVPATNVAT